MKRIVQNGNRIHSCGMNFVRGYYPQKGNRYCPFAWRNPKNRNEIFTDEKGDHDFDYLQQRWFKAVVEGDTAEWSDPFYDGYDNTTALAAYMVPIHDRTGQLEADAMPLSETMYIMVQMDELRRRMGVVYPMD